MGPDLICVGVELFSQNTCVKDGDKEETVTRENLVVALTEAAPADGQLIKSNVTLVYKSPPWPIFEKDAVYTSELKKKSLLAHAPATAPTHPPIRTMTPPTPAPPSPSDPTPTPSTGSATSGSSSS